VDVFDDKHQWPLGGDALYNHRHDLEQTSSAFCECTNRIAQLRHQTDKRIAARASELKKHIVANMGCKVADYARNGRVRETAKVDALADDHKRASSRSLGNKLTDQPGLADTSFAAEQDGSWRAI
jgi:hypothetical protein